MIKIEEIRDEIVKPKYILANFKETFLNRAGRERTSYEST